MLKIQEILLTKISDHGMAILRLWLGLMMIKHSSNAVLFGGMEDFTQFVMTLGVPIPNVLAVLAKFIEFVGGILLTIGLLTRPIALLIAVHMLIAITLTQGISSFFQADIPATYLLIGLAIVLNGPGKWSLDARIFSKVV